MSRAAEDDACRDMIRPNRPRMRTVQAAMTFLRLTAVSVLLATGVLGAQLPDAKQVAQERAQAELDAPKLRAVLQLEPGMVVADVGAGFGAMTVTLAKWIAPGRVYATDVGDRQLTVIHDYITREGLDNVTVLRGDPASTNLPDGCCDAIFLRHVYHHITAIEPFNRSLFAALKPGGRLAIIDFVPSKGSTVPEGVPANREGHGIPLAVVRAEIAAAGFVPLDTIDQWPPGGKAPAYFLVSFRKPQ
jgi:predicted methyltransferase